jgi:hypothetical protein
VPIVPYAVDVPESTHERALVLISAVFVVASSVRTIELVIPVPHIAEPAFVPYPAPTANAPMLASAGSPEPTNLIAAVTRVGNTYTLVDASAVALYVTDTPPNPTVMVVAMSCFAFGTMAYRGTALRAGSGDAVERLHVAPVDEIECVAPIGSAELSVTVSAACFPIVTTEVPDGPLLVTPHATNTGNPKIDAAYTVTAAAVRVDANVNVNVTAAPATAVTVAPRTLFAERAVPSVATAGAVVVSVSRLDDAEEPALKLGRPIPCELLNVNDVCVAYDAMSA